MTTENLILLELNEVNFDYIRRYATDGRLPVLANLISRHGVSETTSEKEYAELEPWIQWVSAHTGLTLAEHNVFRLGDIREHDYVQIWEHLEDQYQCSVAAVSPMNANNKTQHASLFIPDPWTGGDVGGPNSAKKLYASVSRLVNDNAEGRAGVKDLFRIALAVLRYGGEVSKRKYVSLILGSLRGKKWRKALVLDLLLADIFLSNQKHVRPDFASLFLNAGAHIQHHYLFNSSVYDGPEKNPEWYVDRSEDPVLEAYELYDTILNSILTLPNTRVMIATGLHQDPHSAVTYYYRLTRHEEFLQRIGLSDFSVLPRMSRDFLVQFASSDDALKAQELIESVTSADGSLIFSVDNRGRDLFCMLTYPDPINTGFRILVQGMEYENFDKDVGFVAIKNGQHNGTGYFVDTGTEASAPSDAFPITKIFDRVTQAFEQKAVSTPMVDRRVSNGS